MLAMVLLVAATLLVAGVGSVLLIRQDAISTARGQLLSEAGAAANVRHGSLALLNQLRRVQPVGQYTTLGLVGLPPTGGLVGHLPASLVRADLDPAPLRAGRPVVGNVGRLAYVLIPLNLNQRQRARVLNQVPSADQPVLVATREVPTPLNGVWWFVLLAVLTLGLAAVAAYLLSNRFTRPLRRADRVTREIADGDLGARMETGPGDMPEIASLSASINAMGDSLDRARQQQRQFLLSVSHDLRTPLTSIAGYAEAIAEGAVEDTGGAARVIMAEAGRLDRLVQDLLDLARLDARRFSLRPERLDVARHVGAVVDSFTPSAAGAGLALVGRLPGPGELWLRADPDRLAQLLSNLVENACRYARARVTVSAGAEGDEAVIAVADDGPGIAPDDLDRVFERHFSSDRRDPGRAGTGLGLAIVAELAAAMGGSVRAGSTATAGGGTTMTLRLPLDGGPGRAPYNGSGRSSAATSPASDPPAPVRSTTGPGTASERGA